MTVSARIGQRALACACAGMLALCVTSCALKANEAPAEPQAGVEPGADGNQALKDILPARPLLLAQSPYLGEGSAALCQPLCDYLSAALEHPIRMHPARTYAEVVDALVAGEVDMALLAPLTYIEARNRLPELRLLVTQVTQGARRYRGVIVARQGAAPGGMVGLKGKRFAFVDRDSTSGYLYAKATLNTVGIEPARDFSEILYGGNHEKTLSLLLAGDVDAAAISSLTWNRLRSQHQAPPLAMVGKTEWIPFGGFVVHPSLPEPAALRLQQTLIDLNTRTPRGRAVLQGLAHTDGFVFGEDRIYDSIREVLARQSEQQAPLATAEAHSH